MPTPEAASPTPIADAAAVATLLLSRGKYFIASKVDKSIAPEAGQAPRHARTASSSSTGTWRNEGGAGGGGITTRAVGS